MKVIKDPKDFKKEITCEAFYHIGGTHWHKPKDYCGAVLEIEAEDIYYREYREDYTTLKTIVDFGVVCPCCDCFIEISGDELPNYVKNKAKPFKEYKKGMTNVC